jgi:O-antigen ligase
MNKTTCCRWSSFLPLKTGGAAVLLFLLLFTSGGWPSAPVFISSALPEITAILKDAETQWMVFLCLAIYFTAFLFLRHRSTLRPALHGSPPSRLAGAWLAGALLAGAISYTLHYSPSISALTLLAGAVIGQGAAVCAAFASESAKRINLNRLGLWLVLLLAVASVWHGNTSHLYAYHSHERWLGPWGNPNVFGLLMGTGFALALGLFVQNLPGRKWVVVSFCLLAALLLGRGLLHSYSRGAWIATVCGSGYLIAGIPAWRAGNSAACVAQWLKNNWLPAVFVAISALVLLFWHGSQTDWHPARRAISAVNPTDFSWRNRVTAWTGALQITAGHPWFGPGWNQSEPLYENYYLLPRLNESAALQMNDYLMLAATLGIPALLCFAMHLWLSLRSFPAPSSEATNPRPSLLHATCRAGAIVLLIGFWFDGGLFKLPTAATFWILLELGAVPPQNYLIVNASNSQKPTIPATSQSPA